MDKVKIGIIGIGNMGSAHVGGIEELNNCVLTAVCDWDPAALERIKPEIRERIGCFKDAETFLKEADIDAVIIATPHYSHPDLAIAALRHGKHILVEKPIAVHKKEAQRLLDECQLHPELKQCCMFNQRTHTAHRKIKELIDNGELGTLKRVNWIITDWFRTQYYYDSGDWRASWRGEGGGVLLNQCPHQLDLFQWFFGLPKRIRSTVFTGKDHDIEVEDEVTAIMEFESGMTGVFIASTGEAPGTNRLEITAERGKVVFEDGKLLFWRLEKPCSEFCHSERKAFAFQKPWRCEIPVDGGSGRPHRDVIENFAAVILSDEALIAPLQEAIRGLELGNAMLYAGLNDCAVTLPIDDEAYAQMLDKLVSSSRYQKKAVEVVPGQTGDFGNSF